MIIYLQNRTAGLCNEHSLFFLRKGNQTFTYFLGIDAIHASDDVDLICLANVRTGFGGKIAVI